MINVKKFRSYSNLFELSKTSIVSVPQSPPPTTAIRPAIRPTPGLQRRGSSRFAITSRNGAPGLCRGTQESFLPPSHTPPASSNPSCTQVKQLIQPLTFNPRP